MIEIAHHFIRFPQTRDPCVRQLAQREFSGEHSSAMRRPSTRAKVHKEDHEFLQKDLPGERTNVLPINRMTPLENATQVKD